MSGIAPRGPRTRDAGDSVGGMAVQRSGPVGFARMAGSSIAGPSALEWVTDFLNAAYFARREDERDVADLRLAFTILTTRWAARPQRRLQTRDLPAFHRAFGALRLRSRMVLGRDELLQGAAALLGDWFPDAAADARRRAHGIAFETREARDAFDPEVRLAHAPLGELTPPLLPTGERHWHAYAAVEVPDPEATLAAVRDPARWPDAGTALGRFTALRRGGLFGQTFEIEVTALPLPRLPVFARGYVTCTGVLEDRPALDDWARRLNAAVAAAAPEDPQPVPDGAVPVLGIELTTHDGHFLGRAVSRIVVFRNGAGTWIRDVGTWDPLPWHLARAYAIEGRQAQEAFWAPGSAAESMLEGFARAGEG